MSIKIKANLRSLKEAGDPERGNFGHRMAEVTIVSRKSNNDVVAEYDGKLYSAIYNVFVGAFFVDDVDGYIGEAEIT
jgi:hypothetical protein